MHKASHPFEGIVLFCGALLLFACIDTTTKYLAAHYNVPLVVAIRYIVHCLLMVALLAPSQGKLLVQTQRTGLVMLRAASLAIASLFMGLALQRMPVAETTAIVFLGPMIVVLLAGPLLGERINDSRTPDIIVQPQYGTIYTGSGKKNAEHGGFSFGDTNVGLIVSNPHFDAQVVKTPVLSSEVAPTRRLF